MLDDNFFPFRNMFTRGGLKDELYIFMEVVHKEYVNFYGVCRDSLFNFICFGIEAIVQKVEFKIFKNNLVIESIHGVCYSIHLDFHR